MFSHIWLIIKIKVFTSLNNLNLKKNKEKIPELNFATTMENFFLDLYTIQAPIASFDVIMISDIWMCHVNI